MSPEAFWKRRVALTALRHNLGSVLGAFLPLAAAWSVAFCCAVLLLRRNGASVSAAPVWYGVGLILGAAAAWWRTQRRFFNAADARVRLEWHLGLHNRLTAAAAGVGAFPPVQEASDGLAFRWERITAALAGSAVLAAASLLLPMGQAAAAHLPTTPPVAWTQTAGWVEALKKDETVQDAALEALRERVDELRQQPAQDWYSHSSLEAGDNLRDQTAQSIAGLQRDLQSALDTIMTAERFDATTPPLENKAAGEALASALKGLELGTLPLNHEALTALKQADLSGLKSLSPAQLAELKKRLSDGTKVCRACLGDHAGKDGEIAAVLAATSVPGGKGGGKSSAPLNLNEKGTDLGTKNAEALSNPDLSRAQPGDVAGVSQGEHTVDKNQFAGPAQGGAISSTGQGGEVVWRNDLTPAERETLQRFFK